MEELRNKLDADSFGKLIGYACPVVGCNSINNSFDDAKQHIHNVHNLNTSRKNNVPFMCKMCGSLQSTFLNLKRHIFRCHPEMGSGGTNMEFPVLTPEPQSELEPMEIDLNIEDGNQSITNQFFFMTPVSKHTLFNQASLSVTKFRCDVGLPESKIQTFVQQCTEMLNEYQRYAMSIIKDFINDLDIPIDNEIAVKMVNDLEVTNPFVDVKTPDDNLAYLSGIVNHSIPESKEFVLGRRNIQKVTRYHVAADKKKKTFKSIKRTKQLKDVMHYISLKDVLGLIIQNPLAREMIHKENDCENYATGTMCTFKDGMLYRAHDFLQRYPFAVRLSVHIDDVEHCNPLGSRKGKQKVTTISFKNFDDRVNATLDRIYTILVVKSKLLKKYGFEKVLQPLMEDLSALESDLGVTLRLSQNENYTLHATVVHVLGDTLAIHELLELMPPQSNIFCRACYISRDAFHAGQFGAEYPPRTRDSIAADLKALREKRTAPTKCGLQRETVLNSLKYFHFAEHVTFDPMHDILEGVAGMVIKEILNHLVNKKRSISDTDLNNRISLFDYGEIESKDRPMGNFTAKGLKGRGHSICQSASQTWLLLRAFPFIMTDMLDGDENFQEIIADLLMITYYSFSTVLTNDMVDHLESVISSFYDNFKHCFPHKNPINKVHHISHYPEVIRQSGPIAKMSCLQFEAKFKISKSQSKTCNNFRNITFSLMKRLNLKQVNSIINHNYSTDKLTIKSAMTSDKETFDFKILLFDFPEAIVYISCLFLNGTSFRPGLVAKYHTCKNEKYGIIKAIIKSSKAEEDPCFIIQTLNLVEFNRYLNSYQVVPTNETIRVSFHNIFSRKSYSLWQMNGVDDTYYISLKYYDSC